MEYKKIAEYTYLAEKIWSHSILNKTFLAPGVKKILSSLIITEIVPGADLNLKNKTESGIFYI